MNSLIVTWFLWSMVSTPGHPIHAMPVHEYKSQRTCEKALLAYRKEVDKAYPEPPMDPRDCYTPTKEEQAKGTMGSCSRWVTWATVELKCSPINPKP